MGRHCLFPFAGLGLAPGFAGRMPATIGLMMLAEPMISTAVQYDEFGVNDVHFAGQS